MPSVVFVHASADLYGSDLAALRVARAAVAAGWDVAATVPHDGPLVHELTAAGVAVRHVDPLKLRRAELRLPRAAALPAQWVRQLAQLRRLARSRRFDVVYTTTAPTLGGSLLAHGPRLPYGHFAPWVAAVIFAAGAAALGIWVRSRSLATALIEPGWAGTVHGSGAVIVERR